MSRCFPFPPPGYEKKLRVEDVTLLAKDKDKESKEKKHKKEKDKEKKNGREKSKERNKEKDKEKHKHKDRDKKNGKKRSRDEKRLEGNGPTAEKVGSNSPKSSCAQELEPRINFVVGATGSYPGVGSWSNGVNRTEAKNGLDSLANGQSSDSQSKFPKIVFSNSGEQRKVRVGHPVENHVNESTKGKDMEKHHNSVRKGEKSKDRNAKRHKGEPENCALKTNAYNGAQIDVSRETAIVQELERRVKIENGATRSQFGAKANVITQEKVPSFPKPGNDNVISFPQLKPSLKLENGSYKLDNGQKDNNQSVLTKVPVVHNFKTEERGCEMEGIEEPEANGLLHDNETRPSKLPRNQPSTKNRRNLTSTTITFSALKQGLTGDSNKLPSTRAKSMGPIRSQSPLGLTKPSVPSKANIGAQGSPFGPTKSPLSIGKDHGKTGSQESHLSTTKPPSTTGKVNATLSAMPLNCQESAKPPLTPRKDNASVAPLELPRNATKAMLPHVVKAPETFEGKELAKPPLTPGKVAGTVGSHESPSITKKPPSSSKKEKRKEKSSKPRPPHPDTKYLSQILSLPKMEELPEFDDSNWLFESKSSSKERNASEEGDEQVWSKGFHIKSADVYALPYVIPY